MRSLRTPTCDLEPQVVAHADEMFVVLCDPAIYEFEGEPPPSVEALRRGYEKRETRLSTDGSEAWLNWVVRLPSGAATGYVQATVLATHASYVAYEFSSQFWRRGIATAAVSAMLLELADNHQVNLFVAVLKKANFRSVGLLRKLGFAEASAEEGAPFESEDDEVVFLLRRSQAAHETPH